MNILLFLNTTHLYITLSYGAFDVCIIINADLCDVGMDFRSCFLHTYDYFRITSSDTN